MPSYPGAGSPVGFPRIERRGHRWWGLVWRAEHVEVVERHRHRGGLLLAERVHTDRGPVKPVVDDRFDLRPGCAIGAVRAGERVAFLLLPQPPLLDVRRDDDLWEGRLEYVVDLVPHLDLLSARLAGRRRADKVELEESRVDVVDEDPSPLPPLAGWAGDSRLDVPVTFGESLQHEIRCVATRVEQVGRCGVNLEQTTLHPEPVEVGAHDAVPAATIETVAVELVVAADLLVRVLANDRRRGLGNRLDANEVGRGRAGSIGDRHRRPVDAGQLVGVLHLGAGSGGAVAEIPLAGERFTFWIGTSTENVAVYGSSPSGGSADTDMISGRALSEIPLPRTSGSSG